MLRINLLPPYIFDKQKKVQVAIVWGVIAAAAIALLMVANGNVSNQLGDVKKQLDEANNFKSDWEGLDGQIKGVNDKVAVTRSKQTFVANSKTNNDAWPAVYEAMRDVTTPTILLESLIVSPADHKRLDFTGFAKDELTIARWWMYLRNNAKDRFDSVSFNLPAHSYVPATAQNNAGGFGLGRMSGMPPGMGRGMMGGPGMGGAPMSSSFGGGMPQGMMSSSMGAGMMGGKAGMMMPGGRGISGMGGFGGGGGFGGVASANVGPAEIEGRPGLNFTGSAYVKEALAPPIAPTWPAGGGATGGMGGFGGMSGMNPAMMGGMGPGMMGGGRMSSAGPPMGSSGAMSAAPGGSMGGKKGGD